MRGFPTLLNAIFVAVILTSLPITAASAPVDRLRLASLDWSPYVSPSLPDEGFVAAIVKAAAQKSQSEVSIDYFPWSRTVQVGLNDADYAGYFPAFYLKEREKSCYFSNTLGNSTVGFASLKNKLFDWQTLQDLQFYYIGVVQDYANGEEFDALVKQRIIRTDTAPSDISNVRKLLAGRVDVIVIDKNVLRQLLITDNSLSKDKLNIVFHAKELTNFSMHICFQHTARGLRLQKIFNAGLNTLNIKQLENQYFLQLQPGVVSKSVAH
ncbi:substrate-binding periplasmic protein [Undibacterium sp. Dicai25W]|uniref:substrate-binding periplasmic protein n=1 Tax=Undibacterium sp. Dicai25W TaxID=3413034 RepID=UPI003BF022E4